MAKSKFEESLESGVHAKLQTLVGNWEGMTKTWFEHNVLTDEAPMTGNFKSILGGRFLLHEYNGSLQGAPFEGIAIYGYDIPNDTFQCIWIDSFHMGTSMMFSTGKTWDSQLAVLGSYGGPEMPEPWGWRSVLELQNKDTLILRAYNISPEGQEDLGTETIYKRIS